MSTIDIGAQLNTGGIMVGCHVTQPGEVSKGGDLIIPIGDRDRAYGVLVQLVETLKTLPQSVNGHPATYTPKPEYSTAATTTPPSAFRAETLTKPPRPIPAQAKPAATPKPPAAASTEPEAKRKPGRRPGSKNKPKVPVAVEAGASAT